ncbi:MAG: helix-turn-helix transcriptional regulator [Variibacter sp.]
MAPHPPFDSAQAIGYRLFLIRTGWSKAQGHERPLGQKEFAELAGIPTRQAWNNAETGDNRIGIDNAIRVCQLTGASLDYIFFGLKDGLPHRLVKAIEDIEKQESRSRSKRA